MAIEQEKLLELTVYENSGVKSTYKGIGVEFYNPKPGEVIVFKFDIEDLYSTYPKTIYDYARELKDAFPNNTIVGIPYTSHLEMLSKDSLIKDLKRIINFLEECDGKTED